MTPYTIIITSCFAELRKRASVEFQGRHYIYILKRQKIIFPRLSCAAARVFLYIE